MVSSTNQCSQYFGADKCSDHLFASWSSMQANKADQAVMRDLKQWLENPNTSAGVGMSEAKKDLAWLEKSKDLSSVNLGNAEKAASVRPTAEEPASSGGFVTWFQQCAGKRK